MIDKVFQVVKNSEKALTPEDLWFHDPDIDFDDENLIISRRGIDNGVIVNASTAQPIYQFSQQDMKNRQVVFRHSGAAYAGKYKKFLNYYASRWSL